jgi:membrane protein YdbS with pleckstrin-like domain
MDQLQEPSSVNSLRQPGNGFQSFDPGNISAERIAGLIFAGIVGIAMVAGLIALFFSFGFDWVSYTGAGVASVLFLLLLWYTIFWPSIEHRHRSWRLSDVGLELRHGVWWKHMHAVPWARVQHADVTQGPIQRMYGVGTLTVHTAGTANSSVNLGGLSHHVAIKLRDEIIRQRTQGDVV